MADLTSSYGYQPSTRTVNAVLAYVRNVFGDQDGVQITQDMMIAWVNNAQDSIVNSERPLKAKATINSVVGQAQYKMTGVNILSVESLHYDTRELDNTSFAQAEQDFLDSTTSGTPVTWYEWGGTFGLYPVPNVVKPITVYYTALATRMTAPTDLLGVPDRYYQALLQAVMMQAYELDENFDASERKRSQFQGALDDFDEEARIAQNMVYESITYINPGY